MLILFAVLLLALWINTYIIFKFSTENWILYVYVYENNTRATTTITNPEMEHIQFKSLSSWFLAAVARITNYDVILELTIEFFFLDIQKNTRAHTQINDSLVFLHAFNSLVCWCWFTFGTLFYPAPLLLLLLLFSCLNILHWFCSMPFHVHTNDSVVLIVLLSMSQRASNPDVFLFVHLKSIGSPTITNLLYCESVDAGAGVTSVRLQ